METINKLLEGLQAQVTKSLQAVQTEAQRMDDASRAATGGKIAVIKSCEVPSSVGRNIALFGPSSSWVKPSWEVCAKEARAVLLKAREDLEAQHAANLPLLENNQRVAQQVKLIMGNLGVPAIRTTYGYATPRARKMTTTNHRAGYLDDLDSACKTNDGYDACKRQLAEFERRIEAYENAERTKEAQLAREREKEAAQRAQLTLLGALAQKYECAAEVDEIVDALAKKDKYFGLAYWLERNRINWNEGPSLAQCGLNQFKVETEEDACIEEAIRERIENWEGDGRTFRDCHYGYDFLYAKADAEVLVDFNKLRDAGLMPSDS